MDFPRGGESTLSDLDKRRIRSLADNDALFNADDSSQDVSLSKKKKRKLPNNATSESSTTPKSTSSASSSPNFLSIKKISPGSNSLALISKISALQIDLLLQDSQKATLSIADVNSYFSDIAAAYLESESSNESDLPSLSDYFHVEQFLSVKVIEVTNKGVNVSISPEILNKDVNVSQLTPGTFIHGYVKSVQDKGYEVDLGLKNISGFLPFASSSQSEPSEKLKLGTQVCGRVEKKSDRVLRLQFATSMELSKSLDYEITRAGALYDAKLVSVTESEVILDYSGVKIHVNNFGVTKQRKDELGLLLSGESAAKKSKSGAAPSFDKKKQQTTLVRITHIDSEKKFVYGSLLDHIVNQNGIPKPDPNIKIGDTLKTRILRHDAGFGLVSAHPENSNILVYVFNSSISDTKPFTYPKVDSLQKTRILSFNPFSNIYFGSMQPSVLSKPFISSSQLEPGLTVRAKIVKFDKIGLFVTFSGFKGLCPIAHLTDTGGNSELTISKLEKVYKVGNEEKFRIWESDPENDRLILTKKKGLMDSELIGYDAEFRGVVTDGVISAVQELGLVVQFFGGVRGFCPKQEMGTAFSEKTYKDDFKSGQLIKCRIVTTDPVNKKLRLSLKLSSPAPSVAKSDAVKVGQIVKGKIVSTHETSFQVQIIPQNITAKLFLDHLTDHPSHIEKIKKDLTESTSNTPKLSNGTSKKSKNEQDEVIELVVYLNNEKRGLVVSMKPALINFVKRNSRHWETNSGENQKGKKSKKSGLMEEFAEYQPKIEVGSKLPSVIKNVKEDSILVEFIGGQTALARKSNISDTFITPDIVMGSFKVGQTVYSTILEISEDDETTNENGIPRKVFVSLKESINFKLEEPELEFEYLQSMLAERKLKGAAVNKLHDKFKIGSVVKGEKGKILPYGMLVTFEDNVSGLVTVAHMEEQDEKSATKKPKSKEKDEATTVTAKVFDIDEEKKVLDLTLKKDIVGNTVSEETKAKLLKAYQAKTSVDMVIQLLKQDYIIGILPQFNNCIVFATSRTYNSVSDTAFLKYKVGKRVTGVLASIGDNTDGRIILVPSRKDVNVKPAKKDKSGGQGTVEVNIGDDVKVVVNSVKPLQVNVKIGQYIGRIYCTEVSDSWEFFKNAEFLHQDGNDTAVTLKARRRPLAKIFKSGQEVECRVLGMNDLKTHNYLPITKRVGGNVLELSLKRKGEEEAPEIKVGDERVGFVTKVTDAYVFVNLTPKLMGRVNLLSTVNTLSKLRRSFKSWFAVGTPVNCKVENMTEKFTDLTILDIISNTEYTPKFKNTVGDRVLCKVVKVDDLGVIVELPAKSFGRCFVTDVDDVYSDGWKKKMVIGSLRECILLSEDDGKWKVSFRESRIDTAASDDDDKSVADEDGEMAEVSKNVIELSDSEEEEEDENNNQSDADNDDKETEEEKTDVESATSKISPISPNYKAHLQECREINSTEEVEENEVLQGFIKNISDKGFFVSLGRDVVARVKISELSDDFVKDWKSLGRVGMLVRGRVISKSGSQIEMSLKKSTVQGKTTTLLNFSDLKKGMKVAGVVKSVKSYGLIIKLDGSNVSGLCHTSELSDKPVTDITKLYTVGDVVKAIILKKNDEKHKLSLGLKASYFTAEDLDDEDEAMAESDEDIIDNSNNEEDEEMEDAENSDDDDESEEEEDSDVEIEDASVGENKVDLFAGVDEIEPLEFNQDDDNDSFADTDSENEKQSASSDSESDGEKNTTSSKKKSRRQKQALKKAEEERIQKLEAKIVNNEQQELPTSATDFDKLMLSSPNSSYLWIQFMAFQLQMAEIEKARAVAERAINTISFREEAEKKNVWVAYLNLENMYGTQETLKSVFDRAVQYNEPRDMYHSLARIYERTGKFEAVEELYKVMMKKFRDSPQVWTTVGLYYITHRKEEMARQILNRSLEALPKYEHVETITKFAQMEFKFGDPERGRTIFEGLVTNHPTKLNIWNVYLDMEMKVGNVDVVRRLFERAITLKFSSKKMKSLFKKYLMFEKTKGTPEGESHVKKLAIEYVNRVTN